MNEKQFSYYSTISESTEGKSLTVHHVLNVEGLAVPREVMRLHSSADFAIGALWEVLKNVPLEPEDDISNIQPTNIDQLKTDIEKFLKNEFPDEVEIAEDIPDELLNALRSSQFKLSDETYKRMANLFGWYDPNNSDIDISDIGQYL